MIKLIYKKFYFDTAAVFVAALLITSLIVWTIQAINYFDFVTEDGHSLKTYFVYSLLNFPKIINRILPFIFLISVFYILVDYEKKNILDIYWLNGVTKTELYNKLIILSLIVFIIQISLSVYLSPTAQFKARSHLKNSNIDLFSALVKEKKFINVSKNLTIFINEINQSKFYSKIFIEDRRNKDAKIIFANKGYITNNQNTKIFKLIDGKVVNLSESDVKIFKFEEIDFNLTNVETKTITAPKLQELNTFSLIECYYKKKISNDNFRCEKNILDDVYRELLKRIYKPIYTIVIALVVGFLIIFSKNRNDYDIKKNIIFIICFFIILFSEIILRYDLLVKDLNYLLLITPIFIMLTLYFLFFKIVKNV